MLETEGKVWEGINMGTRKRREGKLREGVCRETRNGRKGKGRDQHGY